MRSSCVVLAVAVGMLFATTTFAGSLPSGTLQVGGSSSLATSWLSPTGYDFGANRHSLDITTCNGGAPVTVSGTLDMTLSGLPDVGEWSHYYFSIEVRDVNSKTLNLTTNTDWLGPWRGIAAQPWDRCRIQEGNPLLGGPELHFCTQGGQTDDGGGWIYPSDRVYGFEMTLNSSAETLFLRIFGKGRTNVDEKQWYDVGTMDVSGFGFDFSRVELYSRLWSDGADCTVSYSDMNISMVPEPGNLLILLAGTSGMALRLHRRNRRA